MSEAARTVGSPTVMPAHGAFANASSRNTVPLEAPEAFADAILEVGGAK